MESTFLVLIHGLLTVESKPVILASVFLNVAVIPHDRTILRVDQSVFP